MHAYIDAISSAALSVTAFDAYGYYIQRKCRRFAAKYHLHAEHLRAFRWECLSFFFILSRW